MQIAVVQFDRTQRGSMARRLVKMQFPQAEVKLITVRGMIPDFWVPKKNTKATFEKGPRGEENFAKIWPKLQSAYDAFVCIDVALAHYILPERDRNVKKVDVLSGMIVQNEICPKPVLFLMDPLWTYGRQFEEEQRAQKTWQCAFHIKKLWRKLNNIPTLENPVRFIMPRNRSDLVTLANYASRSKLIAVDIETTGNHISCIGFACTGSTGTETLAFVIPFYHNMPVGNGLYWDSDETTDFAMGIVKNILDNPVPKCYHNGSYDQTFQFKWHMPANAFVFDTQHMLHATWPSIDKRLFQGAAMFLDEYRYWKDDAKDAAEDDKTKKHYMPSTTDGHYFYWRYNALDCANTLELCLSMLYMWQTPANENIRYPNFAGGYEHVWLNYVREFSLQMGPAFYMSMTGMPASRERQEAVGRQLYREADKNTKALRSFICDPDFNPRAPKQVQELYYDICEMPVQKRKGRTTDKRIVQALADMHPIYGDIVSHVNKAKEPANNASKYANLPLQAGRRLLYQIKMGTTTTARAASSKHNYKVGTNVQNYPYSMRVFAHAEQGEVYVSADYSQSDSYFVAFESQDETMIETVTNDKDTHSEHVTFFFGYDYESVVAGAAEKADWVVHPVTGVRQIIKKVSHGTNYDMGGETMLLNVRKDAAIAMVKALASSKNATAFAKYMGTTVTGLADVASWPSSMLAKACDFAQSLYYKRYPKLASWKKSSVVEAAANNGVIPMFGGSSAVMLGNVAKTPRFVPAAYGQGGTAGNINNAMLRLYYLNPSMWDRGFRLVLQVHDELGAGVPESPDGIRLAEEMKNIMEAPCVIHGRKFVIPVEADVSYVWSGKYAVTLDGKLEPEEIIQKAKEKEQKLLQELELT